MASPACPRQLVINTVETTGKHDGRHYWSISLQLPVVVSRVMQCKGCHMMHMLFDYLRFFHLWSNTTYLRIAKNAH